MLAGKLCGNNLGLFLSSINRMTRVDEVAFNATQLSVRELQY